MIARWPQLRKAFDENYLDAIWYLSENPDSTEKTITALKGHLKSYFSQFGNSLPPRFLWKRLWQLYRTETSVLLKQCQTAEPEHPLEDYFA